MAIRVLYACVPRMLSEILTEAWQDEAGLLVVGEVERLEALPDAIRLRTPDVVLVGSGCRDPRPTCEAVLRRFPDLKLVVVEGRGQDAALYELTPTRTWLGEPSPGRLASWIRQAVRPGGIHGGGHGGDE